MSDTRRDAAGRFDFQAAGCAYLAEASRMLADSLEYETTLANVAALALPGLGAWCIVDVVEEDGSMRRLAVVHPDPSKQALARRLASGWPPEAGDPLGVPLVAQTRRAEVVEEVTDEMLVEAAHDEENLRTLRALGIGSLIVAPMLARGHVHGAMTFVSPREHHYGPRDVELAEDLARRAAMAIENARLYRAATLVADVAQSMVVLGGSAETGPRLLRDGSRIQRLVAELHAEQRRRLGWSGGRAAARLRGAARGGGPLRARRRAAGRGRRGRGRHRHAAPAADAADQPPGIPRGRAGGLIPFCRRQFGSRYHRRASHGVNGVNGV
ncbi:MAG: GAF domain-containing protein, partial [Longimicrobiaceae bacterium]